MKWTRTFGVGLALALAACTVAPADPPPTNGAAAIDGKLLQARRAFAAAEIEWQSAIAVGRALVARGVIRGDAATTVRGWNAQARRVIVAGKAATDAGAQLAAAADLLGLAAKLDALTGRK